MPAINPSLIPTISPGNLFDKFTSDSIFNVRWLTATDPAFFEVINRPMGDITVRQLVIAKAIDNLNIALGHQSLFPFIMPPIVESGSMAAYVPVRLFWDFHVSVPVKWANVKLARIDRMSGDNDVTGGYTGVLRFVFTANERIGSSISGVETAVFFVDYTIDSLVTFQRATVTPANTTDVPGFNVISTSEQGTIDGTVVFNTVEVSDTEFISFIDVVMPGTGAQYFIANSPVGTEPTFSPTPVTYGTGMLTSSAINFITPVDADPNNWIQNFNYPFDIDADLVASDTSGVEIPRGLFREFSIIAPAGDIPTGSTGSHFPVWVSRIVRDGDAPIPTLALHFATYGVDPGGPANPVEFATLTLTDAMGEGDVVGIVPDGSLLSSVGGSGSLQDFGRGHVVLSSKWGATGGEVSDFFGAFPLITGGESVASFTLASTRVSSFGVHRSSRHTPSAGQAEALRGSTSGLNTPIHPGSNNKYVTELDEGLGDQIDLDAQSGISSHSAISRFGNTGTRAHKLVRLFVDPAATNNDPDFYAQQVLPRLQILLGRSPKFGDMWFNGNRFLTFDGSNWIG